MKFLFWGGVLALFVVIHVVLEQLGAVDSIGWWYTLYSAAIGTTILAGIAFLVRRIARLVRKWREDGVNSEN